MALKEKGKGYPTEQDLPHSDGIPMENDAHGDQARKYLIHPLRRLVKAGHIPGAFVGGNSFVYYDPEDAKRKRVGPDFYVVNGGPAERHACWVSWEHDGRLPTQIVELTSKSTVSEDRKTKFALYRDVFRTPDYFLFDWDRQVLEGFHLEGRIYVAATPNESGRFPCRTLPLELGIHEGWLRFFHPDGRLVRTDEELAQQAEERALAAENELRILRQQMRDLKQS